uniref:Myoglobin n=1 Tax=Cyprinus carpio TaxID=7962 RepID=A0A8C1XWV8_CYPCA
MIDYEVVEQCLETIEADYAGHGGEVLKRLLKKHLHLDNGAAVLKKLCKLLKARNYLAYIIRQMDTSYDNTDNIVLDNFRLITEALMEVMKDKQCLTEARMGYALKRVMNHVIKCIKENTTRGG